MGTAALSLAFLQESAFVVGTPFTVIADALLVAASVLALVLIPRYVSRPNDRDAFAHELTDPAHGAMLATFPAGLLVLAVAWARVGSEWLGSNVGLAVSAVLVIAGSRKQFFFFKSTLRIKSAKSVQFIKKYLFSKVTCCFVV